jgi:hypothetical protein
VLKAIVRFYDETVRERISPAEVQRAVNFDEDTTQRAIRALYRQPYLEPGYEAYRGGYTAVGPPTGDALRLAGQWPTPENMVERLIAAFEAAAQDEGLDEPERTRAEKIRDGLLSGGSKIAIAALGSAGGHML